MGLFDEIDEDTPATVDVEKNRLFETLEKEGRGIRDYLKVMLPIVVIAIGLIGAAIWFGLRTSVGDRVRPSNDLYDAAYDYLLTQQKRTPLDMAFYYCGDYYSIDANVEKRTVISKPEDNAVE